MGEFSPESDVRCRNCPNCSPLYGPRNYQRRGEARLFAIFGDKGWTKAPYNEPTLTVANALRDLRGFA